MDSEKIIHVKFENQEAREAKKSILLTEAGIIKIHGYIKEFLELRKNELKNKSKMNTKLKKVVMNLKKLEALNPEIKKPKILRKSHQPKHYVEEPEREEVKIKPIRDNLEQELIDIQDRLKRLDEKF